MKRFTALTVREQTTAPRAKYAIPAERVYKMTAAVRLVTITLDFETLIYRPTRVVQKHNVHARE